MSAALCFIGHPAVHNAPDDSLKDHDCMGWLQQLSPVDRAPWTRWIRRLRLADRLAECSPRDLAALQAAWELVCRHEFHDDAPRAAETWSRYLEALAYYHHLAIAIRTVAEHDEMLVRLSGPLLQLAPGMPEELWDAAAHFGALDQFWNNVRDMHEDAQRGMCWLPEAVMRRHGVTREDFCAGRAAKTGAWREMMLFWLGVERGKLERAALSFIEAQKPEPLRVMQEWTLRRYARIERCFRAADFDYGRSGGVYWADASREMGSA